jgi:hypothetical protein
MPRRPTVLGLDLPFWDPTTIIKPGLGPDPNEIIPDTPIVPPVRIVPQPVDNKPKASKDEPGGFMWLVLGAVVGFAIGRGGR